MITYENAKDFLPILQAIIDGKRVVIGDGSVTTKQFDFALSPENYTIIEPHDHQPREPWGGKPRHVWLAHQLAEMAACREEQEILEAAMKQARERVARELAATRAAALGSLIAAFPAMFPIAPELMELLRKVTKE